MAGEHRRRLLDDARHRHAREPSVGGQEEAKREAIALRVGATRFHQDALDADAEDEREAGRVVTGVVRVDDRRLDLELLAQQDLTVVASNCPQGGQTNLRDMTLNPNWPVAVKIVLSVSR